MNLKRVVPNLLEWTSRAGEDYTDLAELYGELDGQWYRYMGHVAALIGGVHADLKTADQAGAVYTPVPRARQRRALDFLAEHVFEAPTWLLEPEILSRIGAGGPQRLQQRQAAMLNSLLSNARLARMAELELTHADVAYPVRAYLDDVSAAVWQTPATTARDPYRRALQRAHVARLAALLVSETDATDIRPLARAQLTSLRQRVNAAAGATGDAVARAHLRDIVERIDAALDPAS
jgi:hypothetical protein